MQKDLIQNLYQEGKGFDEIQKELKKQFGEHAYKTTAIYKHIREAKLGPSEEEQIEHHGNLPDDQLLIRISQEVENNEFFSVRSLAKKLNSQPSLIYRYLTQYLGLVFKNTRWIPHSLNFLQKNERMKQSAKLFSILKKSKHNGYRDIITGDQSWFLYNYSPKGAWVFGDEDPPVFSNSRINNEKIMITVIWGVHGTYIVDMLPEGEHLNSIYFAKNILGPLEDQKDEIWPGRGKHKIWLHLDNCRVHNSKYVQDEMKKTCFKRAPHPPYSPDIAPSDFFLFGYVKEKLRGESFKERNELYQAIVSIIEDISEKTKRNVFQEWTKRCFGIHSNHGEYYTK